MLVFSKRGIPTFETALLLGSLALGLIGTGLLGIGSMLDSPAVFSIGRALGGLVAPLLFLTFLALAIWKRERGIP